MIDDIDDNSNNHHHYLHHHHHYQSPSSPSVIINNHQSSSVIIIIVVAIASVAVVGAAETVIYPLRCASAVPPAAVAVREVGGNQLRAFKCVLLQVGLRARAPVGPARVALARPPARAPTLTPAPSVSPSPDALVALSFIIPHALICTRIHPNP